MDELTCSFCFRRPREVEKLISGPRVFICDGCVRRCAAVAGGAADPDLRRGGPMCSFCGKMSHAVEALVERGEARICNECVHLCLDILAEEQPVTTTATTTTTTTSTLTTAARIGITIGDPCGVGPDLVKVARLFAPSLRVFGDATGFAPGKPDERSGRAQVAWLEEAVAAARAGEIDALVTAPISKAWARRAGFEFPGHTEFLAARLGAADVAMMMVAPRMRVTLATVHVPLRDVPSRLSTSVIERAIGLTVASLATDFGVASPRVGVCGLNPHAGEEGLCGDEERTTIAPAIEGARAAHPEATILGPLPADTAFAPVHAPPFDAIVAMYHDQGLAPIKALAFHDTVNVTLGLPIVRTSPDHGVAYDLAGTYRANPSSLLAAVRLAAEMSSRRPRRASPALPG